MKLSISEPDVLLISEEPQPNGSPLTRLVLAGQQLSDKQLLESMIAVTQTPGQPISKFDAISALVAQKVLELNLENGSAVVFPTSSLIIRNFSQPESPKGKSDGLDGTLFELRRRLDEANQSRNAPAIMNTGLALGDRAVHFSAGWYDNKHIKRVMSKSGLDEYGRNMARLGYKSALDAASTNRHLGAARIIESIVPPIKAQFPKMVKVIGAFTPKESENVVGILN